MPRPPSVVRRKTIVRIDIDDDGSDDDRHRGSPSRSVAATEGGQGGSRAKENRSGGPGRDKERRDGSDGSQRGREGTSAGGRAPARAGSLTPPRGSPHTPTVARAGARNTPSIELDDDDDYSSGDSPGSRARCRKRLAASARSGEKATKRTRESSSGEKAHSTGGRAARSVAEPSKRGRHEAGDAAPARRAGAVVASSTRSRNGDRGKVTFASKPDTQVYFNNFDSDDGDEDEEAEEEDKSSSSEEGEGGTGSGSSDDSSEEEEDVIKGKSNGYANGENRKSRRKSTEESSEEESGDSGESSSEGSSGSEASEEGDERGESEKESEDDDESGESEKESEDDDDGDGTEGRNREEDIDAVKGKKKVGDGLRQGKKKKKKNDDVMKGKTKEDGNGNSSSRCKPVEKEAGDGGKELGDGGNSIHGDINAANSAEEEATDSTDSNTDSDTEHEEEKEEEEEEEEEESHSGEEESGSEEEEEESGEARQDPRATPSRKGEAGGSARPAGDVTPRVGKRKFEGLWFAEEPDTTSPPPGEGVSKRTRSHRRCSNKKLLKRGFISRPVCIDISSSGSEPEGDVPSSPEPAGNLQPSDSDDGVRRPAKKRRRCREETVVHSGSSDDDDDSDDDRTFFARNAGKGKGKGPSSSRPMNESSSRRQQTANGGGKNHDGASNPRRGKKNYAANAGTPAGGGNPQGEIVFKKSSMCRRKAKHGEGEHPAGQGTTYSDLLTAMVDELGSNQNGSAAPDPDPAPAHAQGNDTLPIIFSFGDDVEVKPERDQFEDQLWAEFDFALAAAANADAHSDNEVEDGQEFPTDQKTLCSQGKHDFVNDDQIGIWCRHCNFLSLEIRHVMAPMGNFSPEREPISAREMDMDIKGILTTMGYEGEHIIGSHKSGPVWGLIPGVREDMFSHQVEAFEFMWKKLAGGIDIELVKNNLKTVTSGCVISHAPGTGKTRLAITFVQSYLELFPQCCPMIIAPKGMLDTWEHEFRKWNVKIPFHILNSLDIHWGGDKTIERLASNDKELARRLSINSIDMKYMRALKLRSWAEGSSIIGLSYSLFTRLAKGEDKDDGKMRKLLLERPDLMILDEGHTPRNKDSYVWKALADVRTEKRIILSGTPFQNNFEELYNTMLLLQGSVHDVDDKLLENGEAKDYSKYKLNDMTERMVDEIRKKLDPFLHIHNGDILQKSLPGLRESVVILNPLPSQERIMSIITKMEKGGKSRNWGLEYKLSLASVHPSLVTRMRKLSKEVASSVDMPALEKLRLKPSEGVKSRFVYEVVRLCQALKERVLVFSQYLEPLDLIMEQLSRVFNWTKGKEILLVSGLVPVKTRQALMVTFNDMNSEAKVMLASTKACGEGITLVGASRVVLLDVVWNPSVGRQAIGRAYRIGQKNIVHTYNLISEGTEEKGKYDKQAKKDQVSKLLFSSEPQPAECNQPAELNLDDRILEEMTGDEKLKDMFVNILPSNCQ